VNTGQRGAVRGSPNGSHFFGVSGLGPIFFSAAHAADRWRYYGVVDAKGRCRSADSWPRPISATNITLGLENGSNSRGSTTPVKSSDFQVDIDAFNSISKGCTYGMSTWRRSDNAGPAIGRAADYYRLYGAPDIKNHGRFGNGKSLAFPVLGSMPIYRREHFWKRVFRPIK